MKIVLSRFLCILKELSVIMGMLRVVVLIVVVEFIVISLVVVFKVVVMEM